METIVFLITVALVTAVCVIGFIAFIVVDSDYYSRRVKSNLSKDNQKFINSLNPKTDEIVLTLFKKSSYNTYVYAKIKDRFISISYDKFKTYSHSESISVDDTKQLVNYLFAVTGHVFTVVDKTKDTHSLLESLKSLDESNLKQLPNKPEEEYF